MIARYTMSKPPLTMRAGREGDRCTYCTVDETARMSSIDSITSFSVRPTASCYSVRRPNEKSHEYGHIAHNRGELPVFHESFIQYNTYIRSAVKLNPAPSSYSPHIIICSPLQFYLLLSPLLSLSNMTVYKWIASLRNS